MDLRGSEEDDQADRYLQHTRENTKHQCSPESRQSNEGSNKEVVYICIVYTLRAPCGAVSRSYSLFFNTNIIMVLLYVTLWISSLYPLLNIILPTLHD